MLRFKNGISLILLILCSINIVLGRSTIGHFTQNTIRENNIEKSTINTRQNTDTEDNNNSNNNSNNNDFWSDLWDLYKVYKQCPENNLTVCLKIKLLTNLEKVVINENNVKLLNGIQFVKDESSAKDTKQLKIQSESEIEASLPRSLEDKDQTLNNLIINKIMSFLKSHTLQIKIPYSTDLERSLKEYEADEEGRGKKNKRKNNGALILIPFLLKGFLVPLAFGALSLLAGKALIVSKLALVLASIIGIKKLLSHPNKETQHEVVVASGGHGSSGWGRDIDLAYAGYNSQDKQTKEY